MHQIWTVQTGHNLGTLQEKVAPTINLSVSGADTPKNSRYYTHPDYDYPAQQLQVQSSK